MSEHDEELDSFEPDDAVDDRPGLDEDLDSDDPDSDDDFDDPDSDDDSDDDDFDSDDDGTDSDDDTLADEPPGDDVDDEDDEDPEDALPEDIDFVIAAYREDGQLNVVELTADLANDLEDLITQLRRLPGDAGVIGFVSLVEEVLVVVRVRGQHVQLLLNFASAALDWPIARDVIDLLEEDLPDPDEDAEPIGDLAIFADLGLSELDLAAILDDDDLGSDEALMLIADKISIGPQFREVAESILGT